MKADFFIDRPVFSTVLSIIIVIVGAIGLALLPVDQYPQIVPPVVRVSASYPGADAQTVTQAVATPIEQELNGTPGMIYMESSSSNSGGFSATVTFDISVDPDLAAVDVQNRLKKAEARLPAEVVQNGISVEKQAASKLMTITLLSSDPKFDEIYLSNYATLNVLDLLRRIPGVGSISNVGSRYYAMQIWVQPDKLADLGLTVKDLQSALKDQNRESAAGVLGQAPMTGLDVTIPITAQGRLSSVSQFEDIVIRANPDGSIIRLKDVARISLEASSYNTESGINGGNAAVLEIKMLPGANAMEVAEAVKAQMEENALAARIRLLSVSFCICPLSVSACPSYTIPKRTRPCGGAVAPALPLSFCSSISFTSEGANAPRPTSTSVPAMIRTILYKNPFPLMRIFIRSPFFSTSRLSILRTVVFTPV